MAGKTVLDVFRGLQGLQCLRPPEGKGVRPISLPNVVFPEPRNSRRIGVLSR